ncbi:MAG: helix-turn-helix domain-containing protein [Candidatus Contendobacter sp.]|nr:MAG: helix-turn-helix domain-containing protein [Candidatus Contendobacter sp.]
MNLKDFFASHDTAHVAMVAATARTSLGYLRGCLYGQRRMSADLAIRLEHASAGLMTARELRPDLPWPSSEAA